MLFRHQMSEAFLAAFLEELAIPPERCILPVANNHIGGLWAAKGLRPPGTISTGSM
jgi:hypothetical protein